MLQTSHHAEGNMITQWGEPLQVHHQEIPTESRPESSQDRIVEATLHPPQSYHLLDSGAASRDIHNYLRSWLSTLPSSKNRSV